MKINFLTPHLRISGGTRIILMYASLLAKEGHDVTVFVRSTNTIRRTVANIFHLGYPKWIKDFKARVSRVSDFTEKSIGRADIIVATTFTTAKTVSNFGVEAGKQFYLVQHDEGLYHGDRSKVDEALALPQKKIVVSTWLRDILRDNHAQSSEVLLNPIDTDLFRPLPKSSHEEIRILLLHHVYKWKGTKEGIEIVKKLKNTYPKIRLMGFGVRDLNAGGMFDEYYFDLPQEKLPWLYNRADIYLCPSWDEGAGLPSMEAMSCGTALVTYDNGGSWDFAFDGKTALVAKHRDMEDLERKLEVLIKDTELRESIVKNALQFFEHHPTWKDQVARLEEIFKEELK